MTRYSAAASAIGYVYQFRLALLFALQDETRSVLIEALDDVEIVEGDGGRLLFQLKHVDAGANLTDLSPDLWKTLRVWSDQYRALDPVDLQFFLVTAAFRAQRVAAAVGSEEDDGGRRPAREAVPDEPDGLRSEFPHLSCELPIRVARALPA